MIVLLYALDSCVRTEELHSVLGAALSNYRCKQDALLGKWQGCCEEIKLGCMKRTKASCRDYQARSSKWKSVRETVRLGGRSVGHIPFKGVRPWGKGTSFKRKRLFQLKDELYGFLLVRTSVEVTVPLKQMLSDLHTATLQRGFKHRMSEFKVT